VRALNRDQATPISLKAQKIKRRSLVHTIRHAAEQRRQLRSDKLNADHFSHGRPRTWES
jgi:hypothetical protein